MHEEGQHLRGQNPALAARRGGGRRAGRRHRARRAARRAADPACRGRPASGGWAFSTAGSGSRTTSTGPCPDEVAARFRRRVMRLLVDTHLLLWAAAKSRRLPREARRLLEDPANEVVLQRGEPVGDRDQGGPAQDPTSRWTSRCCGPPSPRWVSPSSRSPGAHAERLASLPPFHKDPFDRMLVAQSARRRLSFSSRTTGRRSPGHGNVVIGRLAPWTRRRARPPPAAGQRRGAPRRRDPEGERRTARVRQLDERGFRTAEGLPRGKRVPAAAAAGADPQLRHAVKAARRRRLAPGRGPDAREPTAGRAGPPPA